MGESLIHSHFCYKSRCAEDLANVKADRPLRVQVEKVIELTQQQYRHFSSHLLEDMPFIAANRELASCDPQGVTHCLLVTTAASGAASWWTTRVMITPGMRQMCRISQFWICGLFPLTTTT